MVDSAIFEAQNLFYQGAYSACIESGRTAPSNDSGAARRLYAARAAVASGDFVTARSFIEEGPSFEAVSLLIDSLEALENGGEADFSLEKLNSLATNAPESDADVVRYCAALAEYSAGNPEGALATLTVDGSGKCQAIECVALGVHILLAINRIDLAEKEFLAARKWGDDAVLVQLMEAWIALARGGRGSQQAFYFYDELSQTTNIANTSGVVPTLVGKAVSSAALGDINKGRESLSASVTYGDDAQVSANTAVFNALDPAGTDDSDRVATLSHPIATDWAAKRAELAEAISSFA
ncbi:hypothetical protein MCUN1_003230 [Malassezia cuniculi]|uniref:Coatomer subunit epsilon n=1 Tax=Malassezia cuniculi TaxID=948313 RepID=A0AAF0ET57_9BASI|nr:hypothetical protein MCUN1_003230 [Malassezia cuniculi]